MTPEQIAQELETKGVEAITESKLVVLLEERKALREAIETALCSPCLMGSADIEVLSEALALATKEPTT